MAYDLFPNVEPEELGSGKKGVWIGSGCDGRGYLARVNKGRGAWLDDVGDLEAIAQALVDDGWMTREYQDDRSGTDLMLAAWKGDDGLRALISPSLNATFGAFHSECIGEQGFDRLELPSGYDILRTRSPN